MLRMKTRVILSCLPPGCFDRINQNMIVSFYSKIGVRKCPRQHPQDQRDSFMWLLQ